MKTFLDGTIGLVGCVLTTISMENLTAWVSVICSILITFATCGLQIYRMIRDRDKDTENKNENNEKE